ncbi:MAG: DUF3159 domain-containing protein [Anaerolineales bacterium]|nr:DUF3159 domain-containing protein [Anaerolineales bacterium]
MNKLSELYEEFRLVFAGRNNLLDTVIPPIIFLIINSLFGFIYAVWGSLAVSLLFSLVRLIRGQSIKYALGGLGGVLLAILIAKVLNRSEGFFLPGVVTGGLTVLVCAISLLIGRPMVAWTSLIVRRWPANWYWHPRVRPAYGEVTVAWLLFFIIRLLPQLLLIGKDQLELLGIIQIVTGWPATIILLAMSYLYGTWRLRKLEGPSVEEFKSGTEPPWEGQRRGF